MALTADAWSKHARPVTLVADAFATKIGTTTAGGKTVANSVTWRVGKTGDTFTEEAKVIVMAGGTTENPRLWLNSSLPNPNDWVGRGYTDHYFDWLIGGMPHHTGSSRGPGPSPLLDIPGHGGLDNADPP